MGWDKAIIVHGSGGIGQVDHRNLNGDSMVMKWVYYM